MSYIEEGHDVDEQLVQHFNRPFGVDEQLSILGYKCHKDQKFLAPSLHGPKRASQIVTKTKVC